MTTFGRAWLAAPAIACLGALPAAAQDNCGGAGTSGAWIGGNEANSDLATVSDFREQLALVLLGNGHLSLFTLSAPAEVRVEALGRGAGDPVIELLDASGSVVVQDDDSGGGSSSRAETALDAGTYCLRTTSFDNAPLTATVRIGRTEHEALTEGVVEPEPAPEPAPEPSDMPEVVPAPDVVDPAPVPAEPPLDPAPAPETPVEASGTCDGAPALAGDLSGGMSASAAVDVTPGYRFTLDTPAAVSITAENEDADPVLTLTGADGRYIDENDDFDGLNARIDVTTPLEAGDYCIGLRALSDPSLPVTVTLSAFDAEAATRAMYDRGEVSPPLDGSYPVTDLGTVANRARSEASMTGGTAQWFSLRVEDSGLLVIEAIAGTSGDPVLTLFDDVGRQIARNDDYGMGLDSRLAERVFPGTYLVALTDISDTSPLLRLVVERYVPAE